MTKHIQGSSILKQGMKKSALALALLLSACSGSQTGNSGLDAGATDAAVGGSCQSSFARGANANDARWCQVDQLLDASLLAPASLPGLSFEVYTTDDTGVATLRYSRSLGKLPPATGGPNQPADPALPIASASAGKFLTGMAVLRAKELLKAAPTAFDLTTPLSTLGCAGVPANRQSLTLRDALQQTLGLDDVDASCLGDGSVDIEACACNILTSHFMYSPYGTQFAYGANNFTVAAALANHALKAGNPARTFQSVATQLRDDLGVTSAELAFPPPNQWGAGYRISGRAYAQYLNLAAAGPGGGLRNGVRFISAADLDAMRTAFGNSITIANSPFKTAAGLDFRYGLGSWVQCTSEWSTPQSWPVTGQTVPLVLDYPNCPVRIQHSLGAQGFMPWIRFPSTPANHGHLAVLATQNTSSGRVSMNSFLVFEMIEPVLAQLLP